MLPNGVLDLLLQIGIWFGFIYAYRIARNMADHDAYAAFDNGLWVANAERGFTGLWELSLQSFVHSSDLLLTLTSWTYWQSQFTVLEPPTNAIAMDVDEPPERCVEKILAALPGVR